MQINVFCFIVFCLLLEAVRCRTFMYFYTHFWVVKYIDKFTCKNDTLYVYQIRTKIYHVCIFEILVSIDILLLFVQLVQNILDAAYFFLIRQDTLKLKIHSYKNFWFTSVVLVKYTFTKYYEETFKTKIHCFTLLSQINVFVTYWLTVILIVRSF